MPFYDGNQFTINFKQITGTAAQSLLNHDKSITIIYTSDATVNGRPFVMVLNAMRGPGERGIRAGRESRRPTGASSVPAMQPCRSGQPRPAQESRTL
jgi:hypothetical protein